MKLKLKGMPRTRLSPVAIAITASALVLSGCDGGSENQPGGTSVSQPAISAGAASSAMSAITSSSVSSQSTNPIAFDYKKLQKTEINGTGLELASREVFEQHVKNGLRLYLSSFQRYFDPCFGHYPIFVDAALDEGQSSSVSSQTISLETTTSSQIAFLPTSISSREPTSSSWESTSSSDWIDECWWIAAPGAASSFEVVSSSQAASSSGNVNDGRNSDNFSETNTYVAGVDQADFAKYDGEHWYIASTRYERRPQSLLTIYDADVNGAELTEAGSLELKTAADNFYLVQDEGVTQAVSFVHSLGGGYYDFLPAFGFWGEGYYGNGEISVDVADVSDATNPTMAWQLSIDGSLIESRKIGNLLHLVSRYEPRLDGTEIDYQDEAIRAANEVVIESASLEDLLPKVRIGDQETVLAPDCYLQQELDENNGFRSLVYVTAIDLASREVVDAECLNTPIQGLSLTTESVYLTGSWWDEDGQQTTIHKFSHQDGEFDYAASGSVWGGLHGRTDQAFRLDEYQGDLRVVTSQGLEHKLFILEQQATSLEVVSQLPNSARPEAIGKPGEDIYSVRFNADSLQIVTFRQTDPLYNIDLSDRLDPKIAGELEIPGFANYIHYVDDHTVFTIGREADERGWVTGLKVALYDISASDPVELQSHVFEGSNIHSEALYDLKAISISPDRTRFIIPINHYDYYLSTGNAHGFLLFEIDQAGEQPELIAAGAKRIVGEANYSSGGRARSVLHNDAVFMTMDGKVWADTWQSLTTGEGLGDLQKFRCDAHSQDRRYLEISIFAPDSYACNAAVTLRNDSTGEVSTLAGSAGSHEYCYYEMPLAGLDNFTITAEMFGQSQTFRHQTDPSSCGQAPETVDFVF